MVGALFTIPIEDLVLGDVVEVRQGDCAPADLRLIQSERFFFFFSFILSFFLFFDTSHRLQMDESPFNWRVSTC